MDNSTEVESNPSGYYMGNSTDANGESYSPTVVHILLGFYAIAFVMNIFGNTLILVSIARVTWLRKKMYAAIQALALADLQVSLHVITLFIGNLTYVPEIVNQIFGAVRGFQVYVAGYHVILVAVDRFVAIQFPIYYQTKITIRRIRMFSALLWVVAAVSSVGEILVFFGHRLNINFGYLSITISRVVPYIFSYTFLTISLCFFHGKVTIAARRRMKAKQARKNTEPGKSKTGLDRATKMMMVVVGVYLTLLTPFFIVAIASLVYRRQVDWLDGLSAYGLLFATCNSSVNFIIYYIFNPKLRAAFRETLHFSEQIERSRCIKTKDTINTVGIALENTSRL